MPDEAPCEGVVIEAHSISRNAALSKIARNQQVYQPNADPFTTKRAEGEPQLTLRYIRQATTFTGFCSEHDSSVFRPIDLGEIAPTREQIFLLHYRSLCRELYVKRTTLQTNELRREADRGRPREFQDKLQRRVTNDALSIRDALDTLDQEKAKCDASLTKRNFDLLQGAFVRFRKTPSLACAGYTQPIFDFAARELQNPDDMSVPFVNLSFTLLPDEDGGVAVFSWFQEADTVCRQFVQSFLRLDDARKSDALVQFVFDSFENFAAQPDWWDEMSDSAKNALKMNMWNGSPMALWYDTASLMPMDIRYADWGVETTGWF
jgi:hypothetical protein